MQIAGRIVRMRNPCGRLSVFLLSGLFLVSSADAAALKKVMLLDFKNVLKKADFNYLEGSITDAVRNKLKEKFAYKEIEREKWLDIAKENFIIEEDLYTYSAAMNLGLVAKQDVVIYGGYVIENKKGSAQQEIRTRVRILDLSKREEIADFEMKNIVDASIFDAVEKIADRIVKEASAVLPNAKDYGKGDTGSDIEKFNQLSLRSTYSPFALSAARSVRAGGQYAAADFKNVIGAFIDFQHFGIWREQFGIFAGGGFRMASDEFTYALDGTAVPVSLQGFNGHAGVTWRQKLGSQFYLQPIMGGGVQYDILKFNYDNKTIAAASSTGQTLNLSELKSFAPYAMGGLRLGFKATQWLFVELGANYFYTFYSGGSGQTLSADLGVGFKL